MANENLISELLSRVLVSDRLIIGLDQYDEILSAMVYVIRNSSSYLKMVINQKDPTHESMISDFFKNEDLNLALQHSKSMGVDAEILSIHPNFQAINLENESLITFDDDIKKQMIHLQTDSEVMFNDKGDCLLFSKYKNKKKLPKHEFINLFSVDKAMSNSIESFFKVVVSDQKGDIRS